VGRLLNNVGFNFGVFFAASIKIKKSGIPYSGTFGSFSFGRAKEKELAEGSC